MHEVPDPLAPLEIWEQSGAVRLLYRFSDAVDNRRPSQVSQAFTDSGLFRVGKVEMRGRAAIEAFYITRLSDKRRRTRHLWSNVESRIVDETEVRIRAVLTNYAFEPEVSESHLQMRIGNIDARCLADTDGRWRFEEHIYERVLAASLPMGVAAGSAQGT
jgi:nuclear transport factor 2 (NTF2) superfamily protein